jgi:hypothetical protein
VRHPVACAIRTHEAFLIGPPRACPRQPGTQPSRGVGSAGAQQFIQQGPDRATGAGRILDAREQVGLLLGLGGAFVSERGQFFAQRCQRFSLGEIYGSVLHDPKRVSASAQSPRRVANFGAPGLAGG